MGSAAKPFINESIDITGARSGPMLPTRWLAVGVCCALVMANVGVEQAAVWTLAVMLSEFGLWITTEPQRHGRDPTLIERRVYFSTIVVANLVWCSFAAFVWMHEGAPFQILALCMLTGQLLHGQAFAARALPIALVVGGLPTVTLISLAGFAGEFEPTQRLLMIGGVAALIGYCARVAGITSRIEAQLETSRNEAIRANADKSTYLSLISHELRTPMSGVLGMAAAMKLSNLSQRQTEQIEVLIRSGENLVQLLNDILDLSKLEAGAFSLDEEPYELAALMHNVETLWRPVASGKGLAFEMYIDPALPAGACGDAHRISQIINNLVSNACKFTDAGSVSVALNRRGESLVLAVADTGPGMTAGEIDRLFQPFVQAAAAKGRRFGGTGLGLFVCRQLATAMGGAIEVASKPGGGSTFTFSMPLRPAVLASTEDQPAPRVSLQGVRVLLVEDNRTNQLVVRTLLEALGCVVEIEDDGWAGVQLASSRAYDVILMDIYLRGIDGYAAFDLLRASLGRSKDVPVIAFTAEASRSVAEDLIAHGFFSVATKPIEIGSLSAQIERAIQRTQSGID